MRRAPATAINIGNHLPTKEREMRDEHAGIRWKLSKQREENRPRFLGSTCNRPPEITEERNSRCSCPQKLKNGRALLPMYIAQLNRGGFSKFRHHHQLPNTGNQHVTSELQVTLNTPASPQPSRTKKQGGTSQVWAGTGQQTTRGYEAVRFMSGTELSVTWAG